MPGAEDREVTKTHPVPTLKGLLVLGVGSWRGGQGEGHVITEFHHRALTQPGKSGKVNRKVVGRMWAQMRNRMCKGWR